VARSAGTAEIAATIEGRREAVTVTVTAAAPIVDAAAERARAVQETNRLLDAFVDALNRRDMNQLRRVYPDMPANQETAWQQLLGAKNIKHDKDSIGDATRGELGLKYSYNNRRDAAGLSVAVVSADRDENEYQEYRGYVTHSIAKWRFALDALTQRYQQAIFGVKNAYQVVGSAGYQVLEILQLSGDLRYTKSPRFDEDYAGLIRASLSFGTGTGGKK
jgi:hypothetical protein